MSDYIATSSFEDLPLSDELRKGIAERGYTQPTPVQAAVFGPIMAGRDMICRSKTGTGKTAAFGIPLLERIPAGARKASALVLCNTRELALQVAQEIEALGKYKDLRVVAIYGGAGMGAQTDALLDGAEVIVGTPGRVYDHIRRGNLKLDATRIAVLDEADEMLSAGFYGRSPASSTTCRPTGRRCSSPPPSRPTSRGWRRSICAIPRPSCCRATSSPSS